MISHFLRRTMVFITLIAAGCTPSGPAPDAAVPGYSVKSIEVSITPEAAGQLRLLQDGSNRDFAAAFQRDLETALRSSVGFDRGAKPARLLVEVTGVRIPSEGARVLLAADSFSTANFVLQDLGTGQEVDQNIRVVSQTRAVRNLSTFNGIPIGALFSTVANAGNSNEEQVVADLVKATALQAADWLKQ